MIIYTTLLITACAPLCGILDIMVAAMYYWKKRSKYGKYKVKMRRQGRGYCVDASDGVDGKIVGDVRRINNREPRMVQIGAGGDERDTVVVEAKPQRMSLFSSPCGWVVKTGEPKVPERVWGRWGLIRTCSEDEVTRKGVVNIWLRGIGSRGYDGRRVRKGKWDEDMEMGERRRME
jgi:hypothetical protein